LEVFSGLEDESNRGVRRSTRVHDELYARGGNTDVEDSEWDVVLGSTDKHFRVRRRIEQCEEFWFQEG
jgi:hypothetical protein